MCGRSFELFIVNCCFLVLFLRVFFMNLFSCRYKQNYERSYYLRDWKDTGGVMVIGYEMYANLTNKKGKRIRKKDAEIFQSTLVDPGKYCGKALNILFNFYNFLNVFWTYLCLWLFVNILITPPPPLNILKVIN